MRAIGLMIDDGESRLVFDMTLLGIMVNQLTFWFSFATNEKRFVKYLLVRQLSPSRQLSITNMIFFTVKAFAVIIATATTFLYLPLQPVLGRCW